MEDKHSLIYGNLPVVIENEHEWLMHEFDTTPDQFRYEFSLRRNAVINYVKKYNFLLNMETIMSKRFQKMILNDLILKRGLNRYFIDTATTNFVSIDGLELLT